MELFALPLASAVLRFADWPANRPPSALPLVLVRDSLAAVAVSALAPVALAANTAAPQSRLST